MKIATWNVNGIRARHTQLCEWIARDRPDILCLQEIKALPEQVPMTGELDEYWCHWHGRKGYSGVGLHIRKQICPAEPVYTHPEFDIENRTVTARLGNLTVASVYVPNGGKDFPAKMKFLEEMEKWADGFRARGEELAICGDLNVARTDMDVHPKERKPNAIGQLPEERALLEKIISQGLVDVGRAVDPDNDRLFTWWAPWRNMRQRNIGWRLDYVLASHSLYDRVESCKVLSEIGTSDHAPVAASFLDRPGT
ncbi:MAG TPA: exodeoxyribonuclease III [Thermodesulfobacteriota bacterium]|nr:exodeoxyribonuclease III [Thermodesulfobacteriota bacterium]